LHALKKLSEKPISRLFCDGMIRKIPGKFPFPGCAGKEVSQRTSDGKTTGECEQMVYLKNG